MHLSTKAACTKLDWVHKIIFHNRGWCKFFHVSAHGSVLRASFVGGSCNTNSAQTTTPIRLQQRANWSHNRAQIRPISIILGSQIRPNFIAKKSIFHWFCDTCDGPYNECKFNSRWQAIRLSDIPLLSLLPKEILFSSSRDEIANAAFLMHCCNKGPCSPLGLFKQGHWMWPKLRWYNCRFWDHLKNSVPRSSNIHHPSGTFKNGIKWHIFESNQHRVLKHSVDGKSSHVCRQQRILAGCSSSSWEMLPLNETFSQSTKVEMIICDNAPISLPSNHCTVQWQSVEAELIQWREVIRNSKIPPVCKVSINSQKAHILHLFWNTWTVLKSEGHWQRALMFTTIQPSGQDPTQMAKGTHAQKEHSGLQQTNPPTIAPLSIHKLCNLAGGWQRMLNRQVWLA